MNLKFDPYKFESFLSDGIPVYFKSIPWANGFVYIRVTVQVGARHDPIGKEGLAHFFEHLPFDGCAGFPTFEAIQDIDQLLFLDTLNANTAFERTNFTAKVSSEKLGEGMDFMRHFILEPVLDSSEIERERTVIAQEIWRRYVNERVEALRRKINKLLYGEHDFGRSDTALGWHDTVAGISKDDFVAFHKAYYHSGNIKIVLVGDIDEHKAKEAVTYFTKHCPKGASVEVASPISQWPKPEVPEFVTSMGEYLGLSGSALPRKTDIVVSRLLPLYENEEVLWLAQKLLRKSIFEQVRGKIGSTYSPNVNLSISPDHSKITIRIEVEPVRLGEVRVIISDIISEIGRGEEKYIKAFDEVKKSYIQRKYLVDDSACEISDNSVNQLAATGRITPHSDDISSAEKVMYADVVNLFSKELNPDQLFWTMLTP